MALLAPITTAVSRTPKPCFFAEHNGRTILRQGQGNVGTSNLLICGDTQADVDAEAVRLGLTAAKTKGERAADYFRSLDPAIQQKFAVVFTALSALTSDAQKALGIQAITTDGETEAAAKAQLLAIFAA